MHTNDVSVFNCRADVRGECAGFQSFCWYSSFYLKHNSAMALVSADNKELLQTLYQLDVCAELPCYRLQPTASHITRCKVWKKFMFSSKIEIIDGCEGLNSSHGSSMQNSSLSLCFFVYTYE